LTVRAVNGFLSGLSTSIGLSMDTAWVFCTAVGLGLIILFVVLALSRRIDRLEESLMDLRQLQVTIQETQTEHARVVRALGSIASALPDLHGFKQILRNANGQQSEHTSALSKVSLDLESMRETVTTSLLNTQSELMTLQESVRHYFPRIEMMQATLTTLQNEQRKLYKVLKTWNSRLKDMERISAAVPSIRTEQAGIRSELAEWNARFGLASEVLAEFLQPEIAPSERPSASETPGNS
jgi:chromosome segregation ATPase